MEATKHPWMHGEASSKNREKNVLELLAMSRTMSDVHEESDLSSDEELDRHTSSPW